MSTQISMEVSDAYDAKDFTYLGAYILYRIESTTEQEVSDESSNQTEDKQTY